MNIPHQPNNIPQPQHLRRESSQSAHDRGYPSQRGGSQRGYAQQHYNPNMPSHSPQPAFRPLPHQHMGRPGMAPAFQPQGAMQQGSPYRQNRSPAIAPATMHQQAYLANPQSMPYYQGQPHAQPVRIPSTMSSLSSISETSKVIQPATVPRVSQQSSQSLSPDSANQTDLDFRLLSNQPNAFLQSLESPFLFSTPEFEQYLTTLPNQAMYGMPQQGMDAYGTYYGQGYGLQQSMYAGVPASPGRVHGFPQQMQAPYGVPSPYGQPPQAQSMSRTPSNMSERPSSAVPQPSTPAMTNVNHISHAHTPSIVSASPAPSSSAFERPKKQSKAIVIKNGKYCFWFPPFSC
jgi:translation initiation factor 4G